MSTESGTALVPASDAYAGRDGAFAAPPAASWVERNVPLVRSLRGYNVGFLRVDAVAGLTGAALAIPSAMGYASIAGLPVQVGLYALLLPVLAYAVLGSSPRLVVGPEGAVAAMIAGALMPLAAAGSAEYIGLAAALAVLVGLVFLAARFARIAGIAEFMSVPVLVGYLTGIAVFLIVAQLEKLTGIPSDSESTLGQLRDVVTGLGSMHAPTVLVAVVAVIALLLLKRIPRFPGALIVVAGSIVASAALDFASRGVRITGPVPSGLPIPAIPLEGLAQSAALIGPAVGIFFVAFSDSILTARSFAARNNETVDTNCELTAFGTAQIAAGLTGGFPIATSGSRTSVNNQTGVRTQMGQVIAVIAVGHVLLFLTAPIQYLPTPVLGAVIVVSAASLIVPAEWRALAASSRAEVGIAVVTALGVVLVGVIPALLVAMLLALIDMARRRAAARDAVEGWVRAEQRFASLESRPDALVAPGVVVYRFDASIFYANATRFKERILSAVDGAPYAVHTVVLDASCMGTTDASAAEAVEAVAHTLRARGVRLLVAELGGYPHEEWEELGLVAALGAGSFHPTVARALQEALRGESAAHPTTPNEHVAPEPVQSSVHPEGTDNDPA